MGFKIKNSLTGEFEKLPILTLKGEKGETGGVEEYNKVDYMGNKYETLKQVNDANVEYAVKTAIGEFNYLDYDGQHITATNSIAGQAKNAVVKGQTLVNVLDYSRWGEQEKITLVADGTSKIIGLGENLPIKPNTKYLTIIPIYENTIDNNFTIGGWDYYEDQPKITAADGTGIIKTIKTTRNTFPGKHFSLELWQENTSGQITFGKPMMIEYQDGMENWDIPYFEGMQSVKMPVLHTVGKNLVDDTALKTANLSEVPITDLAPIKVEPNKSYYVGLTLQDGKDASTQYFTVEYKDENGIVIAAKYHNHVISFTEEQAQKIKTINIFTNKQHGYSSAFVEHLWVVESSEAVPYEPYKSNTLSTPEDLELRGIGEVQDELNVATGELTQRIGEVVLDGSDNFKYLYSAGIVQPNSIHTRIIINNISKLAHKTLLNDKLPLITPQQAWGQNNYDGIGISSGTSENQGIDIRLWRKDLATDDLNGIKEYLSKNPITVQYELTTESVKTVDLSDNHVYSYKDVTHYDCSSAEGSLVPTLSVKVPTDVQATIAQQRETIQTLNSENERLNQIQEELKALMLDSQVQLMNLSWDIDFEVFTLRESIAPKDSLMDSKTGSNIDKFSQAKFIIENDCPDLEKLNSQIEYYFSKDVFSQEQFEELTDLISIVKGENGCEY